MKRLLTILTCSIFCAFHLQGQQESLLTDQYLKDNVTRIKSIDAGDTDFSDLTFLAEELDGVEIVLLGEQGHGDGATFLAKTRLIKYLHEELGFTVLSFESGLKDVNRVWESIKNGNDKLDVFDQGVFPIWTESKQVESLMNYVIDQSKTSNPLIFSGFDMQPTGNGFSMEMRVNELMQYLDKSVKGYSAKDYPVFVELFSDLTTAVRNKPSSEKEAILLKELRKLQDNIASSDASVAGKIMSRYIFNIYKTLSLYWNANLQNPSSTPHIFNSRDREMARNMTYLKEVMYPSQKIIVWAANTHIGYNRAYLQAYKGHEAPDRGMIPMGSYLKTDYQDKVYTVSFSSGGGKAGSANGEIRDLKPMTDDSLEYRLSEMGVSLGFLRLRPLKTDDLEFVTRLYGHSEMKASWAKMTDAIFFIKTMEASTKR